MAIILRDYQKEAIVEVKKTWDEGSKRTIVAMPTGTGKTWLFVFLIYAAQRNNCRCVVLVNTDELVQQTVDKLGRVGVACGIVKAKKNEWQRDVVVASIQTLSKKNRLLNIPQDFFGFVIVDECHYANSQTYQRVLNYFDDAYYLGVTATPFRGDKKSLATAGWESISYVYHLSDAIRDGWLVPLDINRVDTGIYLKNVRLSHSKILGAEFGTKSLSQAVNTPERNNQIVEKYIKEAENERVIAFCVTIDHAWSLANAFRKKGIEAHLVHGNMPEKPRRRILMAHRQGLFPVITNCNVLTHGYDDPGLDGIIMARPTHSKVLYIQSIGRGLRPSKGKKECKLFDVVDISDKHNMAINAEILGLQEELAKAVEQR